MAAREDYETYKQGQPRSFVRLMFNEADFAHLVDMLTEHAPEDYLTLRLRSRLAKAERGEPGYGTPGRVPMRKAIVTIKPSTGYTMGQFTAWLDATLGKALSGRRWIEGYDVAFRDE